MTRKEPGDDDDLEFVVEVTRHERFRELLDPEHLSYEPRYWEVIRGLARQFRNNRSHENELPSVVRQAANFAGTVARTTTAALHGEPVTVPDDVYQARLAVCQQAIGLPSQETLDGHCDHYRPSDGRCSACGCFLAGVVGKARIVQETCPLGRWPDDPPVAPT